MLKLNESYTSVEVWQNKNLALFHFISNAPDARELSLRETAG